MNLRQLPIIPTIIVLAAVATMVALGFWQLGRADEKEALIAKYEKRLDDGEVFTGIPPSPLDHLYSQVSYDCGTVEAIGSKAGRNANGQSGFAHIARCHGQYLTKEQGTAIDVAIGWSRNPASPIWEGGSVVGTIGPGGELGWRIVASEPLAGLQPLAKPDPRDLPNNHLAYAGQWFFFALTALVIYFLAVRKELSERRED